MESHRYAAHHGIAYGVVVQASDDRKELVKEIHILVRRNSADIDGFPLLLDFVLHKMPMLAPPRLDVKVARERVVTRPG